MKVTTYLIDNRHRRQLVRDGWMSRPPMTYTYDSISLGDFLTEMVKAHQQDPNFNVRGALHTVFGKCERYFLTDNKKRLFGIERKLDNAFETDITDMFVSTIENQVKRHDTDVDHLAKALTEGIEKTEAHEAAILRLNVWGY